MLLLGHVQICLLALLTLVGTIALNRRFTLIPGSADFVSIHSSRLSNKVSSTVELEPLTLLIGYHLIYQMISYN